jgi:hypothetical protein
MRRAIILTCLLSLASAHLALGQAAAAPPRSSVPPPHRFFDAANVALIVAESAALLADGVYTQRDLTRFPEWGYEADPIARPFVNDGWTGQILGGALVVSAEVGLRYLLHRSGHHRLERLVPLGLIVYGTLGATHNARVLNEMETFLRECPSCYPR